MIIALLVLSLSDIPLQTAGQTHAPVCLEFCEPEPIAWTRCLGGGIWCPREIDWTDEELRGSL